MSISMSVTVNNAFSIKSLLDKSSEKGRVSQSELRKCLTNVRNNTKKFYKLSNLSGNSNSSVDLANLRKVGDILNNQNSRMLNAKTKILDRIAMIISPDTESNLHLSTVGKGSVELISFYYSKND